MASIPSPGEPVPEQVREKLREEPPDRLRMMADVSAGEEEHFVPQYFREAVDSADDQTRESIADWARSVADFLESEGFETLEAATEAVENEGSESEHPSSGGGGFLARAKNSLLGDTGSDEG